MTKEEEEKPETSKPRRRSLLEVAAARDRLLSVIHLLEPEALPLNQAAGRVLASDVVARFDYPPFANSSMDGFAVRSQDVAAADREHPISLPVVTDIPAGQVVDVTIQPGQAARIMTGAALPRGADTVVPVEDTDFSHRQPGEPAPARVQVYLSSAAGQNIRPSGQDLRSGDQVLHAGTRLRAQDVGLLAMLGEASVRVYRRPRVAIFSSGDELLPVDQPLTPGKIHDSNSYTLMALVEKHGAVPLNLGTVSDQAQAVQEILDRAVIQEADLILSSAGVSVGAFDFVRTVVEQGGQLDFWRVNMRPGKPLAFGNYRGIPFVGLPGNPVSSFVGFEVFVRPALLKMSGRLSWDRLVLPVELEESVYSDGRESYLRGSVEYHESGWRAKLAGHQGSGNLRSLVQANALLLIPSGVKSLPAGARVNAWLLDEL